MINTTSFGPWLCHKPFFFVTSVKPLASSGRLGRGQRLPAVEENATNDRQRRDEVCR